MDNMTFAERVKYRRQQLGLSQYELGALCGLSNTQIFRYEAGTNDATGNALIALAKALRTTPDWLLGFSEAHSESLTSLEVEALQLLRSKAPERLTAILEILRLAN